MITIKRGDITNEDVDVIVNAANSRLAGGGGVDGAIHRAAGPSVMAECRAIGGCPTGEAVMTKGGKLKAKAVIHTVGPVWHGGRKGEPDLLRKAYLNSFRLAQKKGLRSIAFPAISTGVYGYPKAAAARIALAVGKSFEESFEEIRYVCFSQEEKDLYENLLREAP